MGKLRSTSFENYSRNNLWALTCRKVELQKGFADIAWRKSHWSHCEIGKGVVMRLGPWSLGLELEAMIGGERSA